MALREQLTADCRLQQAGCPTGDRAVAFAEPVRDAGADRSLAS
jgi:hypothetical protein